jgi:hypothetical protein
MKIFVSGSENSSMEKLRSRDRKEIINLNDWKNVKSQFQTQFATPKITHATK